MASFSTFATASSTYFPTSFTFSQDATSTGELPISGMIRMSQKLWRALRYIEFNVSLFFSHLGHVHRAPNVQYSVMKDFQFLGGGVGGK